MSKQKILPTDYISKLNIFGIKKKIDHFKEEVSTGCAGFDKSIIKARFHLL